MFAGEMFIPLYTGKLIDILQTKYSWDEFLSAIILMTFFSFGRSVNYMILWILTVCVSV